MSDPFFGEIRLFAFTYAPQNWAYCNGQSIDIRQNPALYSLVGITYGGDGKNTFKIPNMVGKAPIGSGSGPTLTPRQAGGTYGAGQVQLLANQVAPHHHTINGALAASPADYVTSPDSNHLIGFAANQFSFSTAAYTANQPPTVLNAGTIGPALGGTNGVTLPHENRQPYLSLNFCICVDGIYPDRP